MKEYFEKAIQRIRSLKEIVSLYQKKNGIKLLKKKIFYQAQA